MTVSAHDPRPPYQQVADVLRQEINAGKYRNERLPSYRELEERFGVANMTARSALRVLREENIIYTVQGRGSFVSDTYPALIQELNKRVDEDAEAPWGDQPQPDPNRPTKRTVLPAPPAEAEDQAEAGTSADDHEPTLSEVLVAIRDEMRAMNTQLQDLRAEVARLSQPNALGAPPKRRPSRATQEALETLRQARDHGSQD